MDLSPHLLKAKTRQGGAPRGVHASSRSPPPLIDQGHAPSLPSLGSLGQKWAKLALYLFSLSSIKSLASKVIRVKAPLPTGQKLIGQTLTT